MAKTYRWLIIVFTSGVLAAAAFVERAKQIETEYLDDSEHLSLNGRLERAFKRQSRDSLRTILNDLADASTPVSAGHLRMKLEVEQHVYEIFQMYYSPRDLGRLGRTQPRPKVREAGPDYYKDIQFALVQNEIRFDVFDTIPERPFFVGQIPPITSLKILDFRPNVDVPGARVIYLSGKIHKSIERFVTTRYYRGQTLPRNVSMDRAAFMEPDVRIYRLFWGHGWHFETDPKVSSIVFDKDLEHAVVHSRIRHRGAEARFERIKGEWRMVETKLTWIP